MNIPSEGAVELSTLTRDESKEIADALQIDRKLTETSSLSVSKKKYVAWNSDSYWFCHTTGKPVFSYSDMISSKNPKYKIGDIVKLLQEWNEISVGINALVNDVIQNDKDKWGYSLNGWIGLVPENVLELVSSGSKVAYNDKVIFDGPNGKLEYRVCETHISSTSVGNDQIFLDLGIYDARYDICSEAYGYQAEVGGWPCYQRRDYEAAARIISKINELCMEAKKSSPPVLKQGDAVTFKGPKRDLDYLVEYSYLEGINCSNDAIFEDLGIKDKCEFASKFYGYTVYSGCWPSYNDDDMQAATRLVNELHRLCSEFKPEVKDDIRLSPKYNIGDEVVICNSGECNGSGYYASSSGKYEAISGLTGTVGIVKRLEYREDKAEWYYTLTSTVGFIAEHALSYQKVVDEKMILREKLERLYPLDTKFHPVDCVGMPSKSEYVVEPGWYIHVTEIGDAYFRDMHHEPCHEGYIFEKHSNKMAEKICESPTPSEVLSGIVGTYGTPGPILFKIANATAKHSVREEKSLTIKPLSFKRI